MRERKVEQMKLKDVLLATKEMRDAALKKKDSQNILIDDIIKAKDMAALFARLKSSRYRELVTEEVEKNPAGLEAAAERFLLMHAIRLLHRRPLSISPIFGYLLSKEIETKNIRLLIHSKSMDLSEKFVDENLIVIKKPGKKVA